VLPVVAAFSGEGRAIISWTNPNGGDWDVASNWSTDTVPASADDVTISAPGDYTVAISNNPVIVHPLDVPQAVLPITGGPDEANSLTFDAPDAVLQENSGSLTIGGALTVDSGLVSLNEANTIGSVNVQGGVLEFGNPGAFGSAALSLSGGEFLSTTNDQPARRTFWKPNDRRRAWNDARRKLNPHHRRRRHGPGFRLGWGRRNGPLAR
jgi:hypothetical protein